MNRRTLGIVLNTVIPGESVFVADYLFDGQPVEVGDRVDASDESGCRFTYRVSGHADDGWILTVDVVERPLVPESFYWVSDDRTPDLLEGEWGWVEVEATPEIKEALLVLRRAVRSDGWPLVVTLSRRQVLREAVDLLWDWLFHHPDESLDDDEAGFVQCQRAWRHTESMATLSDPQLEILVALLQTWSGPLEAAIDTAVRLSSA